tara:strand:+ start:1064 stop:1513 length:450 start_codon:yes stop_codon:yes gene_type:complete
MSPTSLDEIATLFGNTVGSIVSERADNKTLSKAKRKQKQIDDAPKKSINASLLILDDKTSNIGAMVHSPPTYWPLGRQLEYVRWPYELVRPLPYISAEALSEFSGLYDQAELKAFYDLGTLPPAQKYPCASSNVAKKYWGSDQHLWLGK